VLLEHLQVVSRRPDDLKHGGNGGKTVLAQELHDLIHGAGFAAKVNVGGDNARQIVLKQGGPFGAKVLYGEQVSAPEDLTIFTYRDSLNLCQSGCHIPGRQSLTHNPPPIPFGFFTNLFILSKTAYGRFCQV
jgi:hypothetical protein